SWLPSYDREAAVSDMIAGITIGLTLIPQSIAYAALAGLTAQYGLYSAFMGAFLYVIFGTIKEVSLGPTSLVALMVLEYCHEKPVEYVVLLGFLAGCIELMMGLLKLGFLVDFISAPIVSGFTSAMSLIIICAQAKGLLGLHYTGHGFVDTLMQLIQRISNARLADSILALCCIVFLLTLRILMPRQTVSTFGSYIRNCAREKGNKRRDEIDLYLNKPVTPIASNTIESWKDMRKIVPNL
ncbi:sodium-independent sulfate anion transporter-like, partial [Ctenocephalides felis]|uniref:sodium-independent sulfate anion transporter-like n=1 Tax=Ctenocephalides felis TaxID=7515 RepID=UPI000E6E30C9